MRTFIRDVMRPLVEEKTKSSPMFWALASRALLTRIECWFESLVRLNHPLHFQAVLACSRAMFELSVDLTLIVLQEGKSFNGLMVWQDSVKLSWAERRLRHDPGNENARAFLESDGDRVLEARRERWGDARHRARWTGNSLEADARKADELRASGFNEYYNEQYPQACWHVHGSGVLALIETPLDMFPYFSTRGLKDIAHFSVVACRMLLELVGAYDDKLEVTFEELDLALLRAQHDVLLQAQKMTSAGPEEH